MNFSNTTEDTLGGSGSGNDGDNTEMSTAQALEIIFGEPVTYIIMLIIVFCICGCLWLFLCCKMSQLNTSHQASMKEIEMKLESNRMKRILKSRGHPANALTLSSNSHVSPQIGAVNPNNMNNNNGGNVILRQGSPPALFMQSATASQQQILPPILKTYYSESNASSHHALKQLSHSSNHGNNNNNNSNNKNNSNHVMMAGLNNLRQGMRPHNSNTNSLSNNSHGHDSNGSGHTASRKRAQSGASNQSGSGSSKHSNNINNNNNNNSSPHAASQHSQSGENNNNNNNGNFFNNSNSNNMMNGNINYNNNNDNNINNNNNNIGNENLMLMMMAQNIQLTNIPSNAELTPHGSLKNPNQQWQQNLSQLGMQVVNNSQNRQQNNSHHNTNHNNNNNNNNNNTTSNDDTSSNSETRKRDNNKSASVIQIKIPSKKKKNKNKSKIETPIKEEPENYTKGKNDSMNSSNSAIKIASPLSNTVYKINKPNHSKSNDKRQQSGSASSMMEGSGHPDMVWVQSTPTIDDNESMYDTLLSNVDEELNKTTPNGYDNDKNKNNKMTDDGNNDNKNNKNSNDNNNNRGNQSETILSSHIPSILEQATFEVLNEMDYQDDDDNDDINNNDNNYNNNNNQNSNKNKNGNGNIHKYENKRKRKSSKIRNNSNKFKHGKIKIGKNGNGKSIDTIQTRVTKTNVLNDERIANNEEMSNNIDLLFSADNMTPVSQDVLGQVNNVMTNELTHEQIVQRGEILRQMKEPYQVRIDFGGGWGADDITIAPTSPGTELNHSIVNINNNNDSNDNTNNNKNNNDINMKRDTVTTLQTPIEHLQRINGHGGIMQNSPTVESTELTITAPTITTFGVSVPKTFNYQNTYTGIQTDPKFASLHAEQGSMATDIFNKYNKSVV